MEYKSVGWSLSVEVSIVYNQIGSHELCHTTLNSHVTKLNLQPETQIQPEMCDCNRNPGPKICDHNLTHDQKCDLNLCKVVYNLW